ncbi:zinc finger protein RFP-like [Emydura macquarii macquarii]|uniref:zinc finger protein RFP-like n=1 Tax=Emydura macquarii macquarii TaxID=1129001 RepID=UPI00352AC439
MAAAKAAQSLQDEASCSICLDYFKDPVTLECGHNFCHTCITRCWGSSDTKVSCPECRSIFSQRNLRPNRQLANVVEIAKQLHLQSAKDTGAGRACEKHQEALKLFCREDQSPICVVCDRSKEHRAHAVVPIEEAFQDYKEQIQSRLEILRKEMKDIAALKLNGEMTSQEMLQQTETERKKILLEFEILHEFLEEKELLLLAQLEMLDKEILKRQDEYTARLTQEISRLSTLISEIEEKSRQPASEFLQDIRSTLNRCETERFQNPASHSLELKRRVKEFSQKHTFLENALSKFKETLSSEPKLEKGVTQSGKQVDKANVTLDPDTAHPQLVLSEDRKSVRWGHAWQDMPSNPRRFDPVPCVLGCEGFISGRHCWEVEVEGSGWAVGVAKESVRRKGGVSLEPEEGIWAVGQLNAIQYVALTSPWTSLPLDRRPRKIRVTLDYEKGLVAFLNTENKTQIFTFVAGTFAESLFPFCWVADKSSKDGDITPVPRFTRQDSDSSTDGEPSKLGEDRWAEYWAHVTAPTKAAAEQGKDVRTTLSKYVTPSRPPCTSRGSCEAGKVLAAMALSPEPRQRTQDFSFDPQTLKQFKVNITLDPDTAGPELILSEDLKGARFGKPSLEMPDCPKRFDTDPCVLGREGFTSGKHYWEVEVDGRLWTVGVARESIRRKGHIIFRPNTGILGLQKYDHLCVALTSPSNTLVSLKKNNNEFGVYLDYELGQVSFYDLSNKKLVFTFPPVSFNGERVFPYFCVLLSYIKLSPEGDV